MHRSDPNIKAKAKPNSLKLAIACKCWDCIGGDADPRPALRIRECQIDDCPLYPHRPFQAKPKRPDGQKRPIPPGIARYRQSLKANIDSEVSR